MILNGIRRPYYPSLSLNGSYQKNALDNTFSLFSTNSTWYSTSYVGLSLSVPIFSGFSKDANLKKPGCNLT